MAVLACIVVLTGFVVSLVKHDFLCLARSGALLVGLGIVVLSRTFIAGSELHQTINGETGLSIFSREHYAKLGEPVPEWVFEQERNVFALGRLGPALSFIGTVIWGFGDLLNFIWA